MDAGAEGASVKGFSGLDAELLEDARCRAEARKRCLNQIEADERSEQVPIVGDVVAKSQRHEHDKASKQQHSTIDSHGLFPFKKYGIARSSPLARHGAIGTTGKMVQLIVPIRKQAAGRADSDGAFDSALI
jgi:hypothetical protein